MTAIGRQTMKTWGDRSNPATGRRLTQFGQREVGCGVLGRRVLAVDGDVRDAQVIALRRVGRVDRVELGCGIVGGSLALIALAWLIGSRGGDDREPTLCKRLIKWVERYP